MAQTSLYAAHEKLKKARSTRTGYRRKRMGLAQGRATTQVKGAAERETIGEAVSGLQSIATMADEWKQQRDMDSAVHSAFTELEEAGGLKIDERKGLKRWTKGKYKYSRGDKELTGADRFQALVDHSAGKDVGGKFWSAPKVDTQSSDDMSSKPSGGAMADNVNKPLSQGLAAIGTAERKAQYDEREWAYDDTINQETKGRPTKFAQEVYEANKAHSPGSSTEEEDDFDPFEDFDPNKPQW